MKRSSVAFFSLAVTFACAGGSPETPAPAAVPTPAGDVLAEGVTVPEGGTVKDGVIYDAKGAVYGCASGGNDCMGPPAGMADAPAEITEQTPIPFAVEMASEDLKLPWRLDFDPMGEPPALSGAATDVEVRNFFINPEAPIEVQVIGRFPLVPGIDGFLFRTHYTAVGEHQWAIRHWDGKDSFVTFEIGGVSDGANARTVRLPVLNGPGDLTVFETQITRADNGDLISRKEAVIKYAFKGAKFEQVSREDKPSGPP